METFRRGQAYTKRFGVEFPELISVVIDAYMPLCAPLARYHFGLGDEPSPRLINPLESRWLENLAKGPLEGSIKQLSQLHRFGSNEDEMKASLRTRERGHGPLKAIFNQMRALQDKWLIVASARAASYLKYPAPNKPALNALIAQWAVASAREIERLDTLGYELEEGRAPVNLTRQRAAIKDAEALAAEGRYEEAVHKLLLQTVNALRAVMTISEQPKVSQL